MKKILLLFSLLFISVQANTQTIHLILVSDYADPLFGKVSIQNETEIQEMFTNVSGKLGYGFKVLYLNNNNQHFNRTDIVSGLMALTINTEDIIIFYYNGYGVYPSGEISNFPSFKLIQSTLSMDSVAKQLKDKNGRLVMVIADTRETNNMKKLKDRPIRAEQDFAKIIARKIFLVPTGIFKIASSQKKSPAYPYFTKAFINNFYNTLEITDSELITKQDMNTLIKGTQFTLDTMVMQSEINTPQKMVASFEKLDKPVKTYLPSTFEVPSWKQLKIQLEILANSAVEEDRKKVSDIVRNVFLPNTLIEVRTENRNINIQNNEVVKISIDDYIKQTEKYDKSMKRVINFNVTDFKMTEDFKKFTSLKIVERIK